MNSTKKQIFVVGGGISGLATAYYLKQAIDNQNLPWTVTGIETSDVLGGMVQTRKVKNCLVERGPDCFSTERPVLLDLCRELGLESELIETKPDAKGLWLREKNKIFELPADFCGLTAMKTSTLINLPCLSVIGKLRMAGEMFVPRRASNEEESLGDFIERRFGHEALVRLAQPFLGSIFGMDLRQVNLRALFPHWIAMEQKHGSLTRAFLAAKRNPNAVISAGFRSLKGGLSGLIETLQEKTAIEWKCGVGIQALYRSGGEVWNLVGEDGHVYSGDAVCLTIPARKAASLLEKSFSSLSEKLVDQPARSVFLVNAIFRKKDWPQKLRGSGVISGLDDAYDLQGASFSSFKFEGRSDEECVLVRLFGSPLKAKINLKKSDDEIQDEIVSDFRSIAGISALPVWAETIRYDQALPSYDMNYLNWNQKVESALAGMSGFYLAGQSYQTGGLSGCVLSAKKTAERLMSDFMAKEKDASVLMKKEAAHVSA